MAAHSTTAVEPGDRYLTREPCCLHCCHRGRCTLAEPVASSPGHNAVVFRDVASASPAAASSDDHAAWIAVKPYSFVFCAPVKGRWLGRGLLDLFLEEFAFVPFHAAAPAPPPCAGEAASVTAATRTVRSAVVPLLLQLRAASVTPPSCTESAAPSLDVSGGATLDRRFTLPAYIEELCEGALWLRGREAECRAVGLRYQKALIDVVERAQREQVNPLPQATSPAPLLSAAPCKEASAAPSEWAAWCRTVLWLSQLPSEAEVDALLPHLLLAASALPSRDNAVTRRDGGGGGHSAGAAAVSAPPRPLLLLQQRDVIYHLVWRREGRMFAHPPLEIIRCDVVAALSAASPGAPPSAATALAMIVVSKPPGLPVHPSGCYRKNTVTGILEDVLGGGGASRFYFIEEHYSHAAAGGTLPHRPYASILHKKSRFELIRVWLRPPPSSTDASAPVGEGSSVSTSPSNMGVSAEDWAVLKALFMREQEATMQWGPLGHLREGLRDRHHDARTLAAATGGWMKRQRAAESGDDDQSATDNGNYATASATMCASSHGVRTDVPPWYVMKAFVVHRLDAATSGVLLFGLNSNTARRMAEAVSNKPTLKEDEDDSADDVNAVAADDMRDSAGSQTQPFPLRVPSSRKVYCARVHGRVDLESLARQQHHCVLRTSSLRAQPTQNEYGVAEDPVRRACRSGATLHKTDTELLVCRPIGCLDHHNSLYWSPDAAVTDAWQQQQTDTKRQQRTAPKRCNSSLSGGRGKGTCTPGDLSAKHERMRQLTRGGRTASLSAATPLPHPVSTGTEAPPVHETSTALSGSSSRVQQYMETLRSATTALQVMHYDAATDQTVVKCTLGTGRTHQLRVHLASLGHPIVHDSKYTALEAHMRTLAKCDKRETAEGAGQISVASAPSMRLASEGSLNLFYETTATGHRPGDAVPQGRRTLDIVAASRNARGCVCPEAIDLHAWQYTLAYEEGQLLSAEVPLPSWAQ
ncbi:hypothetical protein LSCM1_06849 [Leishmania martiniquensis]|uniref:Pseudouridine synthase RsuA/RluA-like domain-containing protein n=1 Tax=Leishmania martiniquensis TaxID=1580590 RepID=A0A836HUI2_9TRYP|nr:hypothetical protein LSCM1_06849 [Leishmania martiniquensis]